MNIYIASSGKTIALPRDPKLAAVLQTKPVTLHQQELMATPYTVGVYKLLRALGTQLNPPFQLQYQWPKWFSPFEAQRVTGNLLSTEERAYVLNDMGTGKTISALAAADWLIQHGEVHRVLVISPLSTLNMVWAREIFSYCPQYRSTILHGTAQQRRERLADKDARFYILNHDGVHILLEDILERRDIDLVIIDELGEYRTPNTRRWKALRDICQVKERVWGMTGSPTPNAPTDAWAQAELITPGRGGSFTAFKYRTMQQLSQFTWVPKPDALEVVHALMQPAVRFTREECIDLPPLTYSSRECKLSISVKKAFDDMLATFHHQAAAGEITAVNEGVKLNKLLQISAGAAYDDNGATIVLDPSARLELLRETIEEANTKVIVFVTYVHLINIVHKYLLSKNISTAKVFGSTGQTERSQIFASFRGAGDPHVLLAHPKTMSHGLNFGHAATVVWYGPPLSVTQYEQANARIARPDQTSHMHVVKLLATNVERRVYSRLTQRLNAQGALLELFEDMDR